MKPVLRWPVFHNLSRTFVRSSISLHGRFFSAENDSASEQYFAELKGSFDKLRITKKSKQSRRNQQRQQRRAPKPAMQLSDDTSDKTLALASKHRHSIQKNDVGSTSILKHLQFGKQVSSKLNALENQPRIDVTPFDTERYRSKDDSGVMRSHQSIDDNEILPMHFNELISPTRIVKKEFRDSNDLLISPKNKKSFRQSMNDIFATENEDGDRPSNELSLNEISTTIDDVVADTVNDSKELIKNIGNESDNALVTKESRKPNVIRWEKVQQMIDLNGWNAFAEFINNKYNIDEPTLPGFLKHRPLRRTTYDRPKAIPLDQKTALETYRINDKVTIEPFKYLRNGNVSILVNNRHYGFVKKENIHFDLKMGEFHTAYIHDINYLGRIECQFESPNFWSRMASCQQRIIDVLKYCNGSMDINDKSEPKVISSVFQMSKLNFKTALGMLYKDRIVEIQRSPPQIRLVKTVGKHDIARTIEKRMWDSRPLWEYGLIAPPLQDITPKEVKDMKKEKQEQINKKYLLRTTDDDAV